MHTFTVVRGVSRPNHTLETRIRDEAEYFFEPLTDAELAQIARRTSRRPGLCLLFLLASPFILEALCRLLQRWL